MDDDHSFTKTPTSAHAPAMIERAAMTTCVLPHSPSVHTMSLLRPFLLGPLLFLLHTLLPFASSQSFLSTASVVNLTQTSLTEAVLFLSSAPGVTLVLSSSPSFNATALPTAPYSEVYHSATSPSTPSTSFLLLPSGIYFPSVCSGLACDILVAFRPPSGASLTYSTYALPILTLNAIYSLTLGPSTWSYFSYSPSASDPLPLYLSLSSSTPTILYVSSSQDPFTYLSPSDPIPRPSLASSLTLTTYPAIYIVGFSSALGGQFNVSLSSSSSASQDGGGPALTIDASEAFVLAITVIVVALPLLLLCCMLWRSYRAKRRMLRDSRASLSASEADMRRRWRRAMEEVSREQVAAQSNGLTEAEIAALPVSLWGREGEREEEGEMRCAICLEDFEADVSEVKTMKCGHVLHADCLDQWLRGSKHCPLCLQRWDEARNVKKPSVAVEVEMATRGKGEEELEREKGAPLRIHAAPEEVVAVAASRPLGHGHEKECDSCGGSSPPVMVPASVVAETAGASCGCISGASELKRCG